MANRSGEMYSTKGFRLYKAINMGINSRVGLPNMQYEKPVIVQKQESCQQTSIGAKRRGGELMLGMGRRDWRFMVLLTS